MTAHPKILRGADLCKSGSEHGHQRAFFAELLFQSREVWECTYAIPNGGARGEDAQTRKIRGGMLKAEGVKAGVPDVKVAWPFNGYAGLYLEMKRPADREKDRRAGRTSTKQDEWHARLQRRGYATAVAYTWEEAIDAVKRYFQVL